MVQFTHSILHILDFRSGITIFSEEELAGEAYEFLEKHIEKALQDSGVHESRLDNENPFWQRVEKMLQGEVTFLDFSKEVASELDELLRLAEEEKGVDVVVCQFRQDDREYLGIMEYQHQIGYTHQIKQQGNQTSADLIRHFAILPTPMQKISIYAFVDLKSKEVIFSDKKKLINGEATYILPDKVLFCTMPISQKETIKKVNNIVSRVAEEYGQNPVEAVSKAKNYLLQNARSSDEFVPEKLGQEVFAESLGMQKDFMEKVQKAKLPASAPAEREFVVKSVSSHKIKTDNGIEISIPSDMLNNPEIIAFNHEADGTISISIRNINKILNK